MMNVALVGPGRIAEHSLVPGLSKVPDAQLWSVMSRDLERARAFAGRHRSGGRRGGPQSARHAPRRPRARRGDHRDSGQAARRADPCRGRGGQARAGRETDGDGCGVGPRHDPRLPRCRRRARSRLSHALARRSSAPACACRRGRRRNDTADAGAVELPGSGQGQLACDVRGGTLVEPGGSGHALSRSDSLVHGSGRRCDNRRFAAASAGRCGAVPTTSRRRSRSPSSPGRRPPSAPPPCSRRLPAWRSTVPRGLRPAKAPWARTVEAESS